MRSLTDRDVRARRLQRHALTAPPEEGSPAGVVRAMHGAHAQIMSAAELSVALRLPGSTRRTVRAALTDRSLTKTFGPRGTVHLVPSSDLATWAGALGAVPAPRSPFAPDVRMSPEQTAEVVEAIREALLDAELTIEELDGEVVRRAGGWAGERVMPAFQGFWPRWRQAVSTAACSGALVFGDEADRKTTYTHPRRRDPSFTPVSGATAVPAFLHGYLRAYGPARATDLARWLRAPVEWCGRQLAAADTEQVELCGQPMWVNAGDTGAARLGRSVRLLPYFDALAVGSQPRELMYPGHAAERALARGQAGNYPVVLVDGVVQGVWHQRREGRRTTVTVETWGAFGPLRQRQLEEQVRRVGEVLESDPVLVLGPVSVGPHA